MARQADSPESLEFPIRANHPIRANRANRFARITPLRLEASLLAIELLCLQLCLGAFLLTIGPVFTYKWSLSTTSC